jgi:putative transposase
MKSFLIRLYPNKSQQAALDANFDCCRFVYNKMIEIHEKKYLRTGKTLSGYAMATYMTKIKKQYKFLKEANSESLQMMCHILGVAYNNFFKKRANYPKFKKKDVAKKAFQCFSDCYLLEGKIKLPKLGKIKFRGGVPPQGKIGCFIISKRGNKYYASINISPEEKIEEIKDFDKIIGVDLGIKNFAVMSNGIKVANPKNFQNSQKQMRRKQKAFSRKIKGSKKKQQARVEIINLYHKIQNRKKDFHHKITRTLIANDKNQAFAMENLNIRGMVKNRCLAKHINDAGWYQFKTFLKYKAADVGKQVFEVDRFYPSSKTCSSCGVINGDLKLSERNWTCLSCEVEHDRDFNASLNIALEAARNVAGGDVLRLERLRSRILSNVYEADKSIY